MAKRKKDLKINFEEIANKSEIILLKNIIDNLLKYNNLLESQINFYNIKDGEIQIKYNFIRNFITKRGFKNSDIFEFINELKVDAEVKEEKSFLEHIEKLFMREEE